MLAGSVCGVDQKCVWCGPGGGSVELPVITELIYISVKVVAVYNQMQVIGIRNVIKTVVL